MTVYITSSQDNHRGFLLNPAVIPTNQGDLGYLSAGAEKEYKQVMHEHSSACHRPRNRKKGDMDMDTGKIIIGFSLILLSLALMANPSRAAGPDISCRVGCGSAVFQESGMTYPLTVPVLERSVPPTPVSARGPGPGERTADPAAMDSTGFPVRSHLPV